MISVRNAQFAFLALLLIFLQFQSVAQYALEGFDLEGNLYAWHDEALGLDKSGLVLGAYEQITRSSKESHPFFSTDTWAPNQLRYKDRVFEGVHLLYNLQEDVLVFRHPTDLKYHDQPIKPVQDQVDYFTLDGHTFRYYPHEILNVSPGFFDELYTGDHFDLIVKRIKDSRAESNSIIYVETDIYLIRHLDEYRRLRRKGSLIRAFDQEKRKEIRQFIKDQRLKIKPGNENDMIQLARFCDELLRKGGR